MAPRGFRTSWATPAARCPMPASFSTRTMWLCASSRSSAIARYRAMAEDLLDAQSHIVRVEKLAGIGHLAAGVAHEVRNPLGAIATYLEVLQRRGADPAVTGEVRRAIDRIERIVQGLLDYGRQP